MLMIEFLRAIILGLVVEVILSYMGVILGPFDRLTIFGSMFAGFTAIAYLEAKVIDLFNPAEKK